MRLKRDALSSPVQPAGQGRTPETRTAFLAEKQYLKLFITDSYGFSADAKALDVTIKIRGQDSPHAIFLHPPPDGYAEVTYVLDGKWICFVEQSRFANPLIRYRTEVLH